MESEVATKVCTKCGKEKAASEDFFRKGQKYKGGLQTTCKECEKRYLRVYWKKYRNQKKEELRRKKEVYYLNNKDKINKYQREYNTSFKRREYKSLWRKNNKDKVRESRIKYLPKAYLRKKKEIEQLSDRYITEILRKKGFSKELRVNRELIDIQRIIIKTKRLWIISRN